MKNLLLSLVIAGAALGITYKTHAGWWVDWMDAAGTWWVSDPQAPDAGQFCDDWNCDDERHWWLHWDALSCNGTVRYGGSTVTGTWNTGWSYAYSVNKTWLATNLCIIGAPCNICHTTSNYCASSSFEAEHCFID